MTSKLSKEASYFNKSKEKKSKKDKFNPKSVPIYYLEDPEGNGLTPEQTRKLWQHGVDTGIVWHLQGWYGRTANDLLKSGYIKKPKRKTYNNQHDYYGNKLYE